MYNSGSPCLHCLKTPGLEATRCKDFSRQFSLSPRVSQYVRPNIHSCCISLLFQSTHEMLYLHACFCRTWNQPTSYWQETSQPRSQMLGLPEFCMMMYCHAEERLAHLPGQHQRSCWAIELLKQLTFIQWVLADHRSWPRPWIKSSSLEDHSAWAGVWAVYPRQDKTLKLHLIKLANKPWQTYKYLNWMRVGHIFMEDSTGKPGSTCSLVCSFMSFQHKRALAIDSCEDFRFHMKFLQRLMTLSWGENPNMHQIQSCASVTDDCAISSLLKQTSLFLLYLTTQFCALQRIF